MKKLVAILFVFTSICVGGEMERPTADEIIGAYLKLPHPEKDLKGQSRQVRWGVLKKLNATPDTAIESVRVSLSKIEDQQQRRELVEAVGKFFRTEESAQLFCELLEDADDQIRGKAIHGLRLLSRRTDRFGSTRTIRLRKPGSGREKENRIRQRLQNNKKETEHEAGGAEVFEPIVKGLLPYLIKAANDRNEQNRVSALYALADTRQEGAVKELRRRLKDSSARVRFLAACFLTEYNDASGLDELKSSIKRFSKNKSSDTIYFDSGKLIASFERITGKSFGTIPMPPALYSDLKQMEKAEKQYRYLIDVWAKWWAWEPGKNEIALGEK